MSQVRVQEPKILPDEVSLRNECHVLVGPAHHVVILKNRVDVILSAFVDPISHLIFRGAHNLLVATLPDAFSQTL